MRFLSALRDSFSRHARALSLLLGLLVFGFISVTAVSGFLLYQIVRPGRNPANFDLSVMMGHPTKFSFQVVGGAPREGWFFPGLRGAPTVVVCHGYTSQRADVLTLVSALADHGFNAFTFDFRGHGSTPGVTTLGYRETAELRSAVQAISTRDDVDSKTFGLWGVDMGGYAVLETAESDARIAAFGVDDAYADPRDMLRVQLHNSRVASLPLVARFSEFGFLLLNYSHRKEPPASAHLQQTAGIPKLFIQSDDRSELSQATLKLYLLAPDPKQIVREPVSYSEMPDDDRRNYETQVVNFFLENIPPTSAR